MGKQHGHGDGSINRRKSDDRHPAVVTLGCVNGMRRRKVTYGTTRKEVAEKWKAGSETGWHPARRFPLFSREAGGPLAVQLASS